MQLRKLLNYRMLVLCIFFLGLTLRFWLFFTEARFAGDTARDLLVGSHIVKYGERPLIGHAASGNLFYYPPYYFYFHALLYAIIENPRVIIGLFVVWQSISIILVYAIGKQLFNTSTGVVAALIVALSQYFVRQQSWMHSGPSTTPLFLLSFLLFIGWAYTAHTKKFSLLLYSLAVLMVGSVVSYSLLIYVPVFLAAASVIGIPRYGWIKLLGLWVITGIVLMLLYGPLYFAYPEYITKAFSPFEQIGVRLDTITRLLWVIQSLLERLIPRVFPVVIIALTIAFVFSFSITSVRARLNIVGLIGVVLFSLVLGSIKTKAFALHYFDAIMPIIVVVFSWTIATVYSKTNNFFIRWAAPVLLIVLIIITAGNFTYEPYENNQYKETEMIARAIIGESSRIAQRNGLTHANFYRVFVYQQYYESWINGPMIWYQIERVTGRRFVSLVPKTDRFAQYNSDEVVFVYCLWYDAGSEDPRCKQDFLKEHPEYESRYAMKIDPLITLFVYKRKDSLITL